MPYIAGVSKVAKQSISSIGSLCRILGIEASDFAELRSWEHSLRFKKKAIPKSGGGQRIVYVPHWRYRSLLKKVNSRILGNPKVIRWPTYLFGSVPKQPSDHDQLIGRDYIACAAVHAKTKSVLKVDIADFFDNIGIKLVEQICQEFLKYPPSVAGALADIACLYGSLPQGAPTSSYFANLVFWDCEERLVERLKRKGLKYTRYVDDITVSSHRHNQDFSLALRLIDEMLTSKDLSRNIKKTAILRSGAKPLIVHSLRVEHAEPRVPAHELKRIRAAVRTLENFSTEADFNKYDVYRRMFNVCQGRVNKLARLKPRAHKNLISRVLRVRPMPSHRDLVWCRRAADQVLKMYASEESRKRYFFKRKFFRLKERLNLLSLSFPIETDVLRLRIEKLRVTYD